MPREHKPVDFCTAVHPHLKQISAKSHTQNIFQKYKNKQTYQNTYAYNNFGA